MFGTQLASIITLTVILCCRGQSYQIEIADSETLKSLVIIMRHGDRAPVNFGPKNLNSDPEFWPNGRARLTNKGKQRAFAQGMITRMRYSKFLTEKTNEIYARSSSMDRCLASAELALAGMYIPHNSGNLWSDRILWQPIPIYTIPEKLDSVLEPSHSCPELSEARKNLENTRAVKDLRAMTKPISDLVTRDFGQTFDDWIELGWMTYDFLPQESQFCSECRLPSWYNSTTKALLARATIESWKISSSTPLLKELSAGPILKEIVKRFENPTYLDSESIMQSKKIFLYSTHDSDLAALLNSLGVFQDHLIGYSDNIYIELHQDKQTNELYVRIFYCHNDLPTNLATMRELFPDCSSTGTKIESINLDIRLDDDKKRCTFYGFKELVKVITQHNYRSICRKGTLPCDLM